MISVKRSRQRPWWYGTHEATGCVSKATKNGVLAESITESCDMLLLTKKFMGISGIPITTNGDTIGIQWSLLCCSAAPSQWRAAGHGLVLKPFVWQPLLITSEIAERKMQWTSNIFKTTLSASFPLSLSRSLRSVHYPNVSKKLSKQYAAWFWRRIASGKSTYGKSLGKPSN